MLPGLTVAGERVPDGAGADRVREIVDARAAALGSRKVRLGVPGSGGIDLRFDHAGVAVVDGAENRDGAAVPTRVPDEQLARAGRPGLRGRVGHDPVRAAFWAACATVSLSAKPLIRATSAAGRV